MLLLVVMTQLNATVLRKKWSRITVVCYAPIKLNDSKQSAGCAIRKGYPVAPMYNGDNLQYD